MASKYLIIALAVLTVAGFLATNLNCATIITGTSQQIQVNSEPPGAKVITDTGLTLVTPSVVTLKKGRAITLTCEKEGYETATQVLNTSFNGWFIGNILIGGIIGMIVDLADGAYMNLDKDFVMFRLTPKTAQPAGNKP